MNDENFLFAVLIGYLIGSNSKKSKGVPVPASRPYTPKPINKPVLTLPGVMQKRPGVKQTLSVPFKVVR